MKQSTMITKLADKGIISVWQFEERCRGMVCQLSDKAQKSSLREALTEYTLPDGSTLWTAEGEFFTAKEI